MDAKVQTRSRGLWGEKLRLAMQDYNYQVGLKMVGECLPRLDNRVELADEKDKYGLPITKITFGWGENDKTLIGHALDQMEQSLRAAGATDVFRQAEDANHLGGTAPDGRRPWHQCRRRRLPLLGRPEPVCLRRLRFSHGRRRQPVAYDPGRRPPHGGSDRGSGGTR